MGLFFTSRKEIYARREEKLVSRGATTKKKKIISLDLNYQATSSPKKFQGGTKPEYNQYKDAGEGMRAKVFLLHNKRESKERAVGDKRNKPTGRD